MSQLYPGRWFILLLAAAGSLCAQSKPEGQGLEFLLNADGSYTLRAAGLSNPVLRASAAVKVNGAWIRASDYPRHVVVPGHAGEASIRYAGREDAPELLVQLQKSPDKSCAELQVTATNRTGHPMQIEALRVLDSSGEGLLNLGGPAEADRVLSDSFSEDRPAMELRDLANAEKRVHRAVGVQLIYNQQSKLSWFVGALTSEKFLSVIRLKMDGSSGTATSSYEVDSTGTTELLAENSLQDSPAQDRVELSLPLAPGETLASERMLVSVSDDYHKQLETYAHMIRDLHHARVSAPTPLGWWSWTAFYFGLNEGTALTNAQWLAQHLKPLGYSFFHIDEGYQFARGEYATPDASLFPHGMAALERKVMEQGLTPGIWTAPFEVSERSYIFAHHPDWLVHNAKGQPIHLGLVTEVDQLYALDTTNPAAQEYLRATYSTLVKTWGIRYIKMDFMEDSAVEGFYFKPHTTALEAQRIGIHTIRDAVGEDVLLDKDGCELLNPVGLVDMGRISQDTGHTFSASKEAAPGIAARYYMNRNYFLADPDAFSVSAQTVDDQHWHGGEKPLSLDEASVSIALSAVSGGLYEIGDDLPTLGESHDRTALVENRDLINMAHLGRSSTPLDLMNYSKEDQQPSLFFLRENDRQAVLTIFNWTDQPRAHRVALSDLGLVAHHDYRLTNVLDAKSSEQTVTDAIQVTQPAHSVRVLKIVDPSIGSHPPGVKLHVSPTAAAGTSLTFAAEPATAEDAIVQYNWDFGDGVSVEGRLANHAYTHAGEFAVKLTVLGVDGSSGISSTPVKVTGAVSTRFRPDAKRRLE